jgi:hypothetical protein
MNTKKATKKAAPRTSRKPNTLTRIRDIMHGNIISPMTDTDCALWIKVHYVLDTEALLPTWKRQTIADLIPSMKAHAPHITPRFRAAVLAAYVRGAA